MYGQHNKFNEILEGFMVWIIATLIGLKLVAPMVENHELLLLGTVLFLIYLGMAADIILNIQPRSTRYRFQPMFGFPLIRMGMYPVLIVAVMDIFLEINPILYIAMVLWCVALGGVCMFMIIRHGFLLTKGYHDPASVAPGATEDPHDQWVELTDTEYNQIGFKD